VPAFPDPLRVFAHAPLLLFRPPITRALLPWTRTDINTSRLAAIGCLSSPCDELVRYPRGQPRPVCRVIVMVTPLVVSRVESPHPAMRHRAQHQGIVGNVIRLSNSNSKIDQTDAH